MLRLDDNAILPNRFRAQVRECFVIGAGYGDISSERAYIRTERLSCVRNDGTALEVKIKGSIFDETGKVGVKGRLVTKQGQVLANALLAGVISGIGQGFQNQYTTLTTSPFGQYATTDPSHAFEAGMSGGVGRAMDRLAQYYISLAEKTFPVIEVDAGRSVDVVLTEGVAIDAPLASAGGAARPAGDTAQPNPALPAGDERWRRLSRSLLRCSSPRPQLAVAADPDEIALLERLKSMYPATQWSSVTRTPIAGVYEAVMGSNLAYVGSDGRHFLFGHLFDMRTQTDLTAPKLAAAERTSADAPDAPPKVSFDALPLADAIKTVHGKGERVLAVFSDPNCPYCKLLDAELAKMDNVTLYTFLLPWISPDRTAAQAAWAHAVPERAHDTAVLDRNLRLADAWACAARRS